nr:YqzL family protein [Rubeoparvulum massiliense]
MNELLWRLFTSTGDIQSYLLYKELERISCHQSNAEEKQTVLSLSMQQEVF